MGKGKRGTRDTPYKAVIVGGGPAGTAIIVRAIRLGVLDELLGPDLVNKSSAGVLLCDAGPVTKLGTGELGHYSINSNTHANKFLHHVVNDRPDVIPSEKVTGTVLEPLRRTAAAAVLERLGSQVAPLEQIGDFLEEVGRVVKGVLDEHSESACLCDTKVCGAKQTVDSGPFQITLKPTNSGPESSAPSEIIYASKLILATGGCQRLPTWSNRLHQNKLMSSEEALSNDGSLKLRKILREAESANQPTGPHVCIVGGSHSALSVAWLSLQLTAPASQLPRIDRPATTSIARNAAWSGRTAAPVGSSPMKASVATTAQRFQSIGAPLQSCTVSILHRSPFRLFYNNKREAEADGFRDLMPTNKYGQINPFGGLRGDAKELYLNIRNGSEARVRLVQVRPGASQLIVQKAFDRASVIVWACGYESKEFQVLDATGVPLPVRSSKGQVEVDHNCRVLVAVEGTTVSESCLNLFAVGLGYGLSATLGDGSPDGSTGRADGVAVYLKHSATVVLSSLVDPTRCFGPNTYSWTGKQELNRCRFEPVPVPSTPESQAIIMKRLCKPRLSSPVPPPVCSPVKNVTKLRLLSRQPNSRKDKSGRATTASTLPVFPPTSPVRRMGDAPQTTSPRCVSSVGTQRLRRAWGAPIPKNASALSSSSQEGLLAMKRATFRRTQSATTQDSRLKSATNRTAKKQAHQVESQTMPQTRSQSQSAPVTAL